MSCFSSLASPHNPDPPCSGPAHHGRDRGPAAEDGEEEGEDCNLKPAMLIGDLDR